MTCRTASPTSANRSAPGNCTPPGPAVPVHPAYHYGFTEDGQGRLLTALLERMGILNDQAQLTTVTVPDRDATGQPYVRTVWDASITLIVSAHHPDESIAHGHARHDHPGVAVLIAYLRAWKVVAPDADGPIQPSSSLQVKGEF